MKQPPIPYGLEPDFRADILDYVEKERMLNAGYTWEQVITAMKERDRKRRALTPRGVAKKKWACQRCNLTRDRLCGGYW